ncbi:hypothetical protein FB451DRAFT_1167929 [Mycena latifolia]|nr:hypothetical protein FB451DRAFT_1167929 [Mycena latifolia]
MVEFDQTKIMILVSAQLTTLNMASGDLEFVWSNSAMYPFHIDGVSTVGARPYDRGISRSLDHAQMRLISRVTVHLQRALEYIERARADAGEARAETTEVQVQFAVLRAKYDRTEEWWAHVSSHKRKNVNDSEESGGAGEEHGSSSPERVRAPSRSPPSSHEQSANERTAHQARFDGGGGGAAEYARRQHALHFSNSALPLHPQSASHFKPAPPPLTPQAALHMPANTLVMPMSLQTQTQMPKPTSILKPTQMPHSPGPEARRFAVRSV